MSAYRVLKAITRKSDNQDFPVGAEVELELTPEGEKVLIERGVIEKIRRPKSKSKQEENDGKV
ncbi:MAG: hypothetical protein DRI81_16325 [Chloroflexi bacterium]|nr:MAG: hypothetical protein DRI81_16325 [Chloroflexota bacterium]